MDRIYEIGVPILWPEINARNGWFLILVEQGFSSFFAKFLKKILVQMFNLRSTHLLKATSKAQFLKTQLISNFLMINFKIGSGGSVTYYLIF